MFEIDNAIKQKEQEFELFLIRLNNPELNQILDDLRTLRRSREIINKLDNHPTQSDTVAHQLTHEESEIIAEKPKAEVKEAETPAPNGDAPKYGSVGDAAAGMLKEANKPLPLDFLYRAIEKLGLHSKRKSFRALIAKDRRNRFVMQAKGLVALNPNLDADAFEGSNRRRLANLGFNLKEATIKILPELMVKGEFSRPDASTLLTEQNPQVAEFIQKASVSATLQSLVKDGYLEETYAGFGSEPKKYKVIKLPEAPAQANLI